MSCKLSVGVCVWVWVLWVCLMCACLLGAYVNEALILDFWWVYSYLHKTWNERSGDKFRWWGFWQIDDRPWKALPGEFGSSLAVIGKACRNVREQAFTQHLSNSQAGTAATVWESKMLRGEGSLSVVRFALHSSSMWHFFHRHQHTISLIWCERDKQHHCEFIVFRALRVYVSSCTCF